jgi:hypothetical protein
MKVTGARSITITYPLVPGKHYQMTVSKETD